MFDASFFVALAFFLFLGFVFYLHLPKKLIGLLDKKQSDIKYELKETSQLKQEAKTLLDETRKRFATASKEAGKAIAKAREEGLAQAEERRREHLERLEKKASLARERIASSHIALQHKMEAMGVSVGVSAAYRVLQDIITPDEMNALMDEAVEYDIPKLQNYFQ